MDTAEYENLVQYKVTGQYPPDFNKKEKHLLRRKAARYEVEGRRKTLSELFPLDDDFHCNFKHDNHNIACNLFKSLYLLSCVFLNVF